MKYLREYSAVHVAARNITKYKCVIYIIITSIFQNLVTFYVKLLHSYANAIQ